MTPSQQTAGSPAFEIGDFLPRMAMPDGSRTLVDLTTLDRAGRPMILWFATDTAAALTALDARRAELDDCDALAFAVAVGADPAGGEATPWLLYDPDDRFAGGLTAGRHGIAVIDPCRRLHRVLPSDALDEAVAACRALHERTPAGLTAPHAPVIVLEQVLEPEVCRKLIGYWESGTKKSDAIATAQGVRADARAKRRADVVITDSALFNEVRERVGKRVIGEIHRAFGIALSNFEPFRIGCYDAAEKGEFKRHRDNTSPVTSHRQFALTINLNTGEYEGGELWFPEYGRQLFQPGAGGAVVFNCNLLHEARPVTKGRRFGMFAFLFDKEHARLEQEMRKKYPELAVQMTS
ncbi:MAG: 2OG-Fe(II) oxygenase [Acetobacterales bacterium]